MLFEVGLATGPQLETTKRPVFWGLRAKSYIEATAVALEAACSEWWEGTATELGMRVGAVPA